MPYKDYKKRLRHNKEYYKKNRNKILKQKKEYRKKNILKLKEKDRIYHLLNKEKRREYMKKWREEHKEEVKKYKKEYNREYHQEHKEEILEKSKRRREKNPNYDKEYYQKNKQEILEKSKEYNQRPEVKKRKEEYDKKYIPSPAGKERNKKYFQKRIKRDINFKIMKMLGNQLKDSLKRYTKTGKIMPSKKYGLDCKAIIEHYEKNKLIPEDYLTSKNKYDNHHIRPLFTFNFVNPDGSTNIEEVKKAWRPENLKLVTKEEHKEIHRKLNQRKLKNDEWNHK